MEHKIKKLFEGADTLTSSAEHLFTVTTIEENHREPQGGCSDGTYYYQTFMHRDRPSNEANNTCYIAKIDMKNGEVVKWSDQFTTLNHSNDIVYNSKRNLLVLCHNNPNKNRITLIDPETLCQVDSFEIPVNIYSIDYSAARDTYVVGLSGGQNIMFLDKDFKPVDSITHLATEKTKRYITQGICSDEELIYCVLWDGRERKSELFQGVVTVYDWSGRYVGIIEYDIGRIEPETITAKHGDLIIVAAQKGAAFFKIKAETKNIN